MSTPVKKYPKKIREMIKKNAGINYNENTDLLYQFVFNEQPEGFHFWYDILKTYDDDYNKTDIKMFLDEFLQFDALDDIEVNEPEIVSDSVVDSVVESFKERSKVGIDKYGVTLDRGDLSFLDWINHAQQEAMDMILYLERMKSTKGMSYSFDFDEIESVEVHEGKLTITTRNEERNK